MTSVLIFIFGMMITTVLVCYFSKFSQQDSDTKDPIAEKRESRSTLWDREKFLKSRRSWTNSTIIRKMDRDTTKCNYGINQTEPSSCAESAPFLIEGQGVSSSVIHNEFP